MTRIDADNLRIALADLPGLRGPGATEAQVSAQMDSIVAGDAARKRMIAEAVVAAANAGERGVWIGRDWHGATAFRVKQAREYLAG